MPRVELNGVSMHYLAPRGLPPPASKVVLLVHGIGGSSGHFEPMMTDLAPELLPVAVDLPGHGESSGVVPDSLENVAHLLCFFLMTLGIDEPICYVGHSFGGLIGLKFTLLHPQRVSRLVLIATAAKFRLHPDFLEQAASGRWDLELLSKGFPIDVSEERKQLVLRDLLKMRVQAHGNALMRLSEEDLRSGLVAIRAPTLFVVPDHDVILSPRHAPLLARDISGATMRSIRRAGHYVHVEQPEVVAGEINSFLQCEVTGHVLVRPQENSYIPMSDGL